MSEVEKNTLAYEILVIQISLCSDGIEWCPKVPKDTPCACHAFRRTPHAYHGKYNRLISNHSKGYLTGF